MGRGPRGWHGVDQLGEDGANPNYNAMVERFEKRFGRSTRNVVVALAYDTARVAIHGIANAAIPHPRWVKEGMERIRWMPATNGGPGTYIQFGPHDRKGYKGDFLTIRELRGGELRFDGYHRPQWPSNRRAGVNVKVYIHELIDIIGHNRARYMHHMTANWCPVAPRRARPAVPRRVGHPRLHRALAEVVNMWELDGWDGLAANFAHETGGGRDQDPSLAEWWAVAASLRRGGVDRIVVPTPWTRSIEQSPRPGSRRGVRPRARHRPPGTSGCSTPSPARASPRSGRWDWSRWGPTRSPWPTTPRRCSCGPSLTGPRGSPTSGRGRPMARWPPGARRSSVSGCRGSAAVVDAPLSPLRIGRRPHAADRRPLEDKQYVMAQACTLNIT